MRTLKELDYHERTDTIMLGYTIGSAVTEHGRLVVTGSGRKVRFDVEGLEGYVELDLTRYAESALEWLVRQDERRKTAPGVTTAVRWVEAAERSEGRG